MDLKIVHEPVPGSPALAFYVLDDDDPEFERGPFDHYQGAVDEITEMERA